MHHWVDNQQRPRETIEIEADSLGHDLAYGWSHFLRGSHPNGRADGGAGETARQDTGEPLGDSGAGDGDEEYSPGGDWDESLRAVAATEARFDPARQGDPAFSAPAAVGAGDHAEPGDVSPVSGVSAGISLPETDAVPF